MRNRTSCAKFTSYRNAIMVVTGRAYCSIVNDYMHGQSYFQLKLKIFFICCRQTVQQSRLLCEKFFFSTAVFFTLLLVKTWAMY